MKNKIWIVAIIIGIVLFFLAFWGGNKIFEDEPYYLKNVGVLFKSESVGQFLLDMRGPAGPGYPFIHALFYPLTHATPKPSRIVSIVLLLAFVFLTYRTAVNLKWPSAQWVGLSVLLIPYFAVSYGLALTEAVGLFFAAISFWLFTLAYNLHNRFVITATLIVSGLAFGMAILSRQPLLLFLPAFGISMLIFKGGLSYRNWIFAVAAVILPLVVFAIWKDLKPPFPNVNKGKPFSLNFLLFSFAYGVIAMVFLNPKSLLLFRNKIWLFLSGLIGAFFLNFLVLKASYTPFFSIANKFLGASTLATYSLVCGSLLVFLGFLFLYNVVFYLIQFYREHYFFRFSMLLGALFVCIGNSNVTHIFSSRYIMQAAILFILAFPEHNSEKSFIIRLVLSGFMGLLSLYSYVH